MATPPTPLLTGGCFFEAPRWHEGRWWVSDFYRHTVHTVAPDGGQETVLTVPGRPSGLGWLPDDSLLAVSMRDQCVLRRWPDGRTTEHATLAGIATGHANDMVVDPSGRAWVGNFGFDLMAGDDPRPATLARIDPGGTSMPAAGDLYFPNGMAIFPDGGTLVVAETFAGRLTAFTVSREGELVDRRTWAQFGEDPTRYPAGEMRRHLAVAPDGCCLDADGCIWVADAVGRRCIRVAEGGEIVDTVTGPDGLGVFACMLGGADGRTLLLCCAPDSSERKRRAAREAALWTVRVDAPHAGIP
ncbi:SMP-30/gluconolactonase/LRE family protein [Aquisalimonas lutea]|uniref:SMP-30/gluconolactonase/LRE family protein n=1 Tax=Aquisalimonas lutea TaxID=1327750 RepID=UPI0025B5D04E|nr:SMP-30/gluconolactonase/LRE family protein [Aquisalimonas lutea]MDN3518772.1 SMP-30/gluconolactonase/LRE family protein [Aquisalimonas lutea]